jgi:hypothetical protein
MPMLNYLHLKHAAKTALLLICDKSGYAYGETDIDSSLSVSYTQLE